jgi:hypothetical protein
MEVVLEDQILHVDSTEEVIPDANPSKKLLKKEQRFIARLQEEQEAEARALERFQQAQTRLERRRKRVERIQGKLALVREQLAELQITGQQTVYMEHELVIVATSESTPGVDSEEVILAQPEQDIVVTHESEDLSSAYVESPIPGTSVPEQEATTISMDMSDVPGDEERGNEQGHPASQQETPFSAPVETIVESEFVTTPEERSERELFPSQQETTSLEPFTSMPIETTPESEAASSSYAEANSSNTTASEHEAAQELEASSPSSIESITPATNEQEPVATIDSLAVEPEAEVRDGVDLSSDPNIERKPTKPLRLEQAGLPATESLSLDAQSAKEAWIAAESAMQNARNAAHGIAASISFLSQNDGLSNEFMEELLRKQADANKDLLKAQDAARAAYERFVLAQRDTESAASLPVDASINSSEDHSQQKQENPSLPPAEDNGADQTAKLHAIRLYKEW